MNKCQVCDKELTKVGDIAEDGRESCPSGHYYYSHSYGSHEAHYDVDGTGFETMGIRWSYTDADLEARWDLVDAFVSYAKALNEKRRDG